MRRGRGDGELAGPPLFWMNSVISKTLLLTGERGLPFTAGAVRLPHVLLLAASEGASMINVATDAFGAIPKQRSIPQTGVSAPRNPPRLQNPQTPNPRLGQACAFLPASGSTRGAADFWSSLASGRDFGDSECLGGCLKGLEGSSSADTCLYTLAWERQHRPISQIKTMVSNSVILPLVKCNGRPKDGSSRFLLVSRPPGRGGSENFTSGGGAQTKSLGPDPEHNESWGVVLPIGRW
jgi:hypothetical protein